MAPSAVRIPLWCFLTLALLRGLGLVVALHFTVAHPPSAELPPLLVMPLLLAAGVVVGSLLAGLQRHPTRRLGLVPLGTTGLVVALAVAAWLPAVPAWLAVLLGVLGGLIDSPLLATYQANLPAQARGYGAAAIYVVDGMLLALAWGLGGDTAVSSEIRWLLAALTLCGAVAAWWALLRDAYDLVLEWIAWPCFRVHAYGPGLGQIPATGPLLVIANHTAWFDPLWLGKVLPRRLTGMLTSAFFDLPVLHFLATKVVHAIRVEQSRYRREAPELAQAVAALDRGEAVLLFPEGQMRKKEERPLHPFGRGVWHILHERPQTPVVVCWIEGAWGSFTSYKGGAPIKNKRLDWWRRIDVAVCAPEVLDAALLEDQRATRNYLMRKVLEARKLLGLEPLAQPQLAHD